MKKAFKGCLVALGAFTAITILIAILVGIFSDTEDAGTTETAANNTAEASTTEVEWTQEQKDSIARAEAINYLEGMAVMVNAVPIEDITTIAGVELQAKMFYEAAQAIEEHRSMEDPDVKKALAKFEADLKKNQKTYFPQLRQKYGKLAYQKMWENDIYVTVSGATSSIITWTGAVYAANRNIKATEDAVYSILNLLRFKKSQFQWYKDASELTTYTLETPKDDVIISTY